MPPRHSSGKVLHMPAQLRTDLLHTYRALLRAVTYLPDSSARTYMHEYIRHRFRSSISKSKAERDEAASGSLDKWIKSRLAKARSGAKTLERAGSGSTKDVQKVLLRTYGRTGKRRRELMADLVRPEEGSLPKDSTELQDLINNQALQPPQFPPDSKFYSFLRSEQMNQPLESSKNDRIRHLKAPIPQESIWGRPVPLKLQASMRRKWWRNTLEKLHPPVPLYEWNRLRDLATGKLPIEEPPPRRARAASSETNWGKLDLLKYFKTPAKFDHADDIVFHPDKGIVLSQRPPAAETAMGQEAQPIPKRTMRRMYAGIWNLTPTMAQDEATQKWTVQWGETRSPVHSGVIVKPSWRDEELFEGTDALPEAKKARSSKWPKKANSVVLKSLFQPGGLRPVATPA